MECQKQNQFCKKKHGGTTPTGTQEDDDYTFRENPKDHDGKCSCDKPQEKKFEVCNLVKQHFTLRKAQSGEIDGCNRKNSTNNWNCSQGSMNSENNGACMPPRRKALCISNLTFKGETKEENKLREAFIKCSAKETYFLWEKYKKNKNEADTQLKTGTIPEEFKRMMYYTFGDYRDILFGTDISKNNGSIGEVNKNINNLFNNNKGPKKELDNSKRVAWWGKHGPDIWEAMLCGLTHHLTEEVKKTIHDNYSYIKMTNDNTSSLEEFSSRPQFLRWFIEWSDDFCNQRKERLETLQKACKFYECGDIDKGKKKTCEEACKKYQAFINKWKDQYEEQTAKFHKDKKDTNKYKDYPSTERAVQKAVHAHEYLNQQLQKICKNGDCSCMKNPSTHSQSQSQPQKKTQALSESFEGNDMPASLDEVPEEFKKKCKCPDISIKECKIHTKKITEPKIPMNCVEKAAYYLAKEEDKYIERTLKQKITHYNYIKKNEKTHSNNISCDPNKPYSPNKYVITNPCGNKGNDRFNVDSEWKCYKNLKRYQEKSGVCVPPRRKHMCLRNLDEIKIERLKDSNYLLKMVRRTARNEGIDIIKNFKSQNGCAMNPICDTMKYSFADLGDIIRGTDMFRIDGEVPPVEKKLKEVFEKLKQQLESTHGNNINAYPDVASFRSAWWDANRKEVWKAMTCSAPEDAKLFRKGRMDGFERITLIQDKCGHKDDPPVDDYIPQRLRWMKEWGEYVCKILNEKINDMKNECDKCKINDKTCSDDDDGNKCTHCKEKCKEYAKLIKNMKSQFDIQKQKYNELYTKAENKSRGFTNDNEKNVIEFFQKVKTINNCDVGTPDKYLDKASDCIHYNFTQNGTNSKPYAFNNQPEKYENHCSCTITNHPLDKCPFGDKKNEYCKTIRRINPCIRRYFDNNLETWTGFFVDNKKDKNKGVLVPPRRRHLCTRKLTGNRYRKNEKNNLKQNLIDSAFNQGILLGKTFKDYSDQGLESMKYSFADYGDIIKGKDMIGGSNIDHFNNDLKKMFQENNSENMGKTSISREQWWEANKTHVWHAMLCGYQKGKNNTHSETLEQTWCDLPTEDDTLQFLRWFQEWTETFCTRKKELQEEVQKQCKDVICDNNTGKTNSTCSRACKNYSNFILTKKHEYESLNSQYDMNYKEIKAYNKEAPNYFKEKCNGKCECLSKNFNEDKKWEKPYETLDNEELKNKCDCQKPEKKIVIHEEPQEPVPAPPKVPEAQPETDEAVPEETEELPTPPAPASPASSKPPKQKPKKRQITPKNYRLTDVLLPSAFPLSVGIAFAALSYFVLKEKMKKGKNEKRKKRKNGNNTTASGKNTPSDTQNDIQNDGIPSSKITDNEWNTLKHDFISQYLQSEQPKDVPNDYTSGNSSTNTNITTPSHDNLDNNTHPTMSRDNMEEKPFITSIHDRNLYSGEEYNYNVNMSTNSMDDPKYVSNNVYSGIDLINDSLNSGNQHIDIYDELLKRKENELFGTNHPKHISSHNVAKPISDDPLHNQLELFHKWLDRHRDMCEKWNNKEDILNKLNEEWNKDNNNNSGTPSDNTTPTTGITPPTSDNTPPTSEKNI
ncbi:hypothetical protein C923_00415 [Plasmodium falciparum UGT5.1]|uniref:Erythrocyte membrane protein 1 n=1 Tax=Plasmodium falciparum UGT5.1 TaxID=1237627 RepID=W7JUT1_PLAFA|nr:hypothetical protein C923_00415 [Plasmodium falciparum UGT5.1]